MLHARNFQRFSLCVCICVCVYKNVEQRTYFKYNIKLPMAGRDVGLVTEDNRNKAKTKEIKQKRSILCSDNNQRS